ncbi:MAG: sensor hybrid histidine kinase [Ramlibacter sp.]|nr:sensor hybrid histidine kinase [Ramlibacter sp.]
METPTFSDPSNFRSAHSVLVVDDNPAMKYSVARNLRAVGYRTVEASGGAEALELSEFVSAVVIDVHLPDLDGFEVCRLLRARRSTAQLPVIHFSSISIDGFDARAAAECGADGFLAAPVDTAELTSTLDRLLARRVQADAIVVAVDDGTPPGDRSGSGVQSVVDQMTLGEKAPGS